MKKIKFYNIAILHLFAISTVFVLSNMVTLIINPLISLTEYGVITLFLSFIVMSFTGDYLYEEMQ